MYNLYNLYSPIPDQKVTIEYFFFLLLLDVEIRFARVITTQYSPRFYLAIAKFPSGWSRYDCTEYNYYFIWRLVKG